MKTDDDILLESRVSDMILELIDEDLVRELPRGDLQSVLYGHW